MREELEKLEGKRFSIIATVKEFSTKSAYRGPPLQTILLIDVLDYATGKLLTDHLWMTAGKWSANIKIGDLAKFDARSDDYVKGYRGRDECGNYGNISVDYRLVRPTKVEIY